MTRYSVRRRGYGGRSRELGFCGGVEASEGTEVGVESHGLGVLVETGSRLVEEGNGIGHVPEAEPLVLQQCRQRLSCQETCNAAYTATC